MSKFDLNAAVVSAYSSQDEHSIDAMSTDGVSAQAETEYQNTEWQQSWGYFNSVPELRSAILMKSIWNVGKGWTADPRTTVQLDRIRGWGKDTFDDILFNMDVIRQIGRDSFAEIVRNESGTAIINLKPLDPGSIKIVVGPNGIIKRYEQVSKVKGGPNKRFELNDIFHLSNNRLADQIHGISVVEQVEKIILAEDENFDTMRKIMRFQAMPFIIFKMRTDDTIKIKNFQEKIEKARKNSEDMFIPDDENLLSWEVVQVTPSQILMDWRNDLKNKFYRAVGLPQIIFGSGDATESGGKVEYLAHEQVFEKEQRYLEKQIWAQLSVKIDLISPVSLLDNLQTDESKDQQNATNFQQNDVTAGSGRDNATQTGP